MEQPIESGRESLARRVFERAHVEGRFRLRSGQVTDVYFDKYKLESDPDLLRELAVQLRPLLPGPDEVDLLAGIELGGIPLVTMLSQLTGIPALFVRKEPKEYGLERLAEGAEISEKRLVVLEDVVTSGGQILMTCKALKSRGASIVRVVCLIDRESGGPDNLLDRGIETRTLFTMSELLTAGRR